MKIIGHGHVCTSQRTFGTYKSNFILSWSSKDFTAHNVCTSQRTLGPNKSQIILSWSSKASLHTDKACQHSVDTVTA